MANTPVDPGAMPTPETVRIMDGSILLDEFPLIRAPTTGFARNRRGYQAFESDEQVAAGDGRRVVGERTMDLLVQATESRSVHARLHDLDAALDLATALIYEGAVFELAGSRGITATQPLGRDIRATVTYLPRLAEGVAAGQPVLGPL